MGERRLGETSTKRDRSPTSAQDEGDDEKEDASGPEQDEVRLLLYELQESFTNLVALCDTEDRCSWNPVLYRTRWQGRVCHVEAST